MKQQILVFIIRWVLSSIGLWVAVRLFGGENHNIDQAASVFGYLFAGLIFSIINSILKPVLVILALPAILVTLGLFMLVVNGLLVYISIALAPGLSMSFFDSILTGIVLSLINYIVSAVVELRRDYTQGENI
jgi:putative membrane protein